MKFYEPEPHIQTNKRKGGSKRERAREREKGQDVLAYLKKFKVI